MDLKKLNEELKSLNEDIYEELSVEQVAQILSDTLIEDIEPEEDDEVKRIPLETNYGKYPMYSLTYQNAWIIKEEDYLQYIKDLASMFANCLPDKFERLFNEGGLAELMLDDYTYTYQTIEFLNKFGYDFDNYKISGSNDNWIALERVYD